MPDDAYANCLRQKLFGIPRVPWSFSGTVGEKSNPLLAFGHLHTHNELWPAVEGAALAKGPNPSAQVDQVGPVQPVGKISR